MNEFNEFSHLWNDLPREERARLMPYMIESHLLHIEQTKNKIIRSHKKLMNEINEQKRYMRKELSKYREDTPEIFPGTLKALDKISIKTK